MAFDDDSLRPPQRQGGDRRRRAGDARHDDHETRHPQDPLVLDNKVLVGFAGSTADAFALLERFEAKAKNFPGNIPRAATELARDWRTDRVLRRLEALMIVASDEHTLLITGQGDVIQPTDGVVGIGSGGAYATAAARALVRATDLAAAEIVAPVAGNRRRDRYLYESRDHRGGIAVPEMTPREIVALLDQHIIGQDDAKRAVRRRHPQPLAMAAASARDPQGSDPQKHHHDRAHRGGEDGNHPPAGEAHQRAVYQGGGHQVHRGRLSRARRREHRPRTSSKPP